MSKDTDWIVEYVSKRSGNEEFIVNSIRYKFYKDYEPTVKYRWRAEGANDYIDFWWNSANGFETYIQWGVNDGSLEDYLNDIANNKENELEHTALDIVSKDNAENMLPIVFDLQEEINAIRELALVISDFDDVE